MTNITGFSYAMSFIKEAEGEYVNHPNDKGGETWGGIARNMHPKWKGWEAVDLAKEKNKTKSSLNKSLRSNKMLKVMKLEFYEKEFWDEIDALPFNYKIKVFLFDYAINSGHENAYKALQRALGVKADGIIGSRTIGAYKDQYKPSLLYSLKQKRDQFYNDIVKSNPSQGVFLDGWLNRSDSALCFGMDCGIEIAKKDTILKKALELAVLIINKFKS